MNRFYFTALLLSAFLSLSVWAGETHSAKDITPDFVNGALGFRIVPQCTQLPTSIGFAWEAPLTPTSEGLMDNRFTADFTVQF